MAQRYQYSHRSLVVFSYFPRSDSCQPGMVINSWQAITLYLFKTGENNGRDDDDNTKIWTRGLGTTPCKSTRIILSNIMLAKFHGVSTMQE
jgi:hypothetical protein